MIRNCAFTIVAKNYIGLAQILEFSFKQKNPEVDFFIVVADDFENGVEPENLPKNTVVGKLNLGIPPDVWADMSFKYDLTEFCTSIKPFTFQYFFNSGEYDNIIYLDPDIYVYNSFSPIYDLLGKHSIIITPHVALISDQYTGELTESSFMSTGIYNLGFCAMKKGRTSSKVLSWWGNKLIDKCYNDKYDTFYTDQKWIDFLPGFLNNDELLVSQHLGLNIAPWNYFEREINFIDNKFMASSRHDEHSDKSYYPVIFVHYSGYNYKELKKGNVLQNNITTLNNYSDINLLTDVYAKAIKTKSDVFDFFIENKYSYGYFDNGDEIKSFHRRIYRSLTNKNEVIENPFSTSTQFYKRLKELGMVKSNGKVNVDKVTVNNLNGVDSKLKIFNKLMRFAYKLLGFERYLLLIRLMRPFSRYESQIHLFNNQYDKENIRF